MGVEVELFSIIGIKTDYDKVKLFKSKTDPYYIWELKEDYIKNDTTVLFKDNIPDDFIVLNDGMGGEYCYFGKLIDSTDDLYNGFDISMSVDDINKKAIELSKGLISLGIKHNFEDIKLHTFTHFS